MPGGRPPIPYDPEIGEAICDMLAETPHGIATILRTLRQTTHPATPGVTTLYKWMASNPEFAESSARARALQADTLVDEAVDVARNPLIGTTTTTMEWGEQVKTGDNVQRSQLIVQTLLKRAGQLAPKKYGDKITQEHTGEIGLKRLLIPDRTRTAPSKEPEAPEFE